MGANLGDFLEGVRERAKGLLKDPSYALLEASLKTKEKFKDFRRTKPDLETLLACAVCALEFTPDGRKPEVILCCSNVRFVNMFRARKKTEAAKAVKSPYAGIRSQQPMRTRTYDLVAGKFRTVSLKPGTWYVADAWMFTDEVLPALVPLLRECLKA